MIMINMMNDMMINNGPWGHHARRISQVLELLGFVGDPHSTEVWTPWFATADTVTSPSGPLR